MNNLAEMKLKEIMTKKCLLDRPDKIGNRQKLAICDFFGNFEIQDLIEKAFKEIESDTIKKAKEVVDMYVGRDIKQEVLTHLDQLKGENESEE